MSTDQGVGEDSALIQRYLSGEENASAWLIRRHQSRVCSLLYSILQDYHLAEECGVEAFVRALRSLAKLRKGERFGTWVTKIALNLAYDEVRRQAKRRGAEEKWAEQNAAGKGAKAGQPTEEKIRQEVDRLPKRQWEVVTLYYWARESYKEIGERLGISQTAVRRRIGRARRTLQRKLAPWL